MFTRILIILNLLVLASCGNPGDGGDSPSADTPRVALVMKSLANEFFKTMEDGARAYHAENTDAFSLITNGIKNEEDVSGQIALVEQMIAQGVDAIVVAPANSQALVPVLKKAVDAGITIVNIDNKLDAEVLKTEGVEIPFIGPDNRAGAKLAGDRLAKTLKKGDQVAIVGGIPSAFNAAQRGEGFRAAMDDAGIIVVSSQAANWEMEKANQIVTGIVNEHPTIDAILCANDSMALGAVAAIRDAGKTADILVIGYDNISAVQELIKDDKMLCTIDQHGDRLAAFGIEFALEILETGVTPTDRETPVDLVTKETLSQ
jgi:ribose transport system substrate-binding protein